MESKKRDNKSSTSHLVFCLWSWPEKARLICIEWTVDQASTTTWGDQISLSPGNVISISSVQQSVSGSVDRERDTVFSIRGSTQTAFVHLDLIRYCLFSKFMASPVVVVVDRSLGTQTPTTVEFRIVLRLFFCRGPRTVEDTLLHCNDDREQQRNWML